MPGLNSTIDQALGGTPTGAAGGAGYASRAMCGIVGKVSPADRVDPALIDRMCEVIEHRGPDSKGIFVDGNVGLGVQRLAIIDLETGDQPIFNEDRSVVVILNGEIYNYRELRESLAAAGHRFATRSDTEVIVHLYEDHGDGFVQFLRGMFAIAVWDSKRRRLVLARDRIGKKPLYFSFDGTALWFASEAKAILQDPAVPRDVDYGAVDAYLHYQYVPNTYCAFAALSKLPPAHVLTFESGQLDQRRYWKLSYAGQRRQSDEEACELIRTELLDATGLRLRSNVPLGAFLSGGVDSSAVVAAMAMQTTGRVKTFTIGFPSARFDERPYAREIAQLFDTEHHELLVEPNLVEVLPRLVWHYGEPFADQSAIPSFYLSELTRRDVTVALNGDGGDESFGGYRRYVGNDVARRLQILPAATARVVARALDRLGTGGAQDSKRARLLRLARAVQLDEAARYAMWVACFDTTERQALYAHDLAERVVSPDVVEGVVRSAYDASDAPTLIERLLDVDTQTYLPDQLLVKMDIASMAHSLEVRSPFLDHVFIEMAARLPLSAKVSRGDGKRLLKRAIRPWIPPRLLDRPKQGFTMPIAEWLRNELRELPQAVLLDTHASRRGLFKRRALEQLITEHQRGIRDHSNKLWTLIQLELWFRTYVDTVPSGPITVDLSDLGKPRRGRSLQTLHT
jgi:asparagine synthase (glutamine-hydrolysing)